MTTGARLRAFVELNRCGSVRAAAARLFVTESSVSSAITALSREVGVPLVERHGRGLRITPPGLVFAEYAQTILGLHTEAFAAARGELHPTAGELRLAAVTTAAEHVLPTLLAGFRERYPELKVRLDVLTRGHIWPLLSRHEVDLVIAGRSPIGTAAVVRAQHPNELVAVIAPVRAGGFDLRTTEWLLREPGSGTRETCEAMLASADVEPPTLTLGSNGAAVAACVAGLGATLVSRDAVRAHLAAGSLALLVLPGLPLSRPWHAVSQPRMTPSAALFLGHLLMTAPWSPVTADAA